jgi:hypothetical protein
MPTKLNGRGDPDETQDESNETESEADTASGGAPEPPDQ